MELYRARVALLSEHASPVAVLGGQDAGGQNVYVDEISRHLAELGYAVDIFVRRERPSDPEVLIWAPGVRVIHLTAGPACVLPKDTIWPLMPMFCTALLDFAQRDGIRYDLVHGNFWMSGWVAATLRRRLGVPTVQIFHATGKTKRHYQGAADTSPPERIAVELAIVRQVDRLIAQCPSERAELLDEYRAAPGKVALIPAAANSVRFRPVPQAEARRRIGLVGDEPLVVYVGRVLPRKDIRNIVRAIAILAQHGHPARLLIVGGETAEPDPLHTPELGALMALANELGVSERVAYTGHRQPDTLRDFYCAGDVAVTTPWYEPFGLTPLEAMACGRPVIGANVGGIAYTIQNGITGLLVPPRDPEALADRLALLLADPDMRERMGAAARIRVERDFTWPTVARRTAALYHELLATEAVPEGEYQAAVGGPTIRLPA